MLESEGGVHPSIRTLGGIIHCTESTLDAVCPVILVGLCCIYSAGIELRVTRFLIIGLFCMSPLALNCWFELSMFGWDDWYAVVCASPPGSTSIGLGLADKFVPQGLLM